MATYEKVISGITVTVEVTASGGNVNIEFTDPPEYANPPGTTVSKNGHQSVTSESHEGCFFILSPAGELTWADVDDEEDVSGTRVCQN